MRLLLLRVVLVHGLVSAAAQRARDLQQLLLLQRVVLVWVLPLVPASAKGTADQHVLLLGLPTVQTVLVRILVLTAACGADGQQQLLLLLLLALLRLQLLLALLRLQLLLWGVLVLSLQPGAAQGVEDLQHLLLLLAGLQMLPDVLELVLAAALGTAHQ